MARGNFFAIPLKILNLKLKNREATESVKTIRGSSSKLSYRYRFPSLPPMYHLKLVRQSLYCKILVLKKGRKLNSAKFQQE
jgi:hypothetical protein